MARSGAGTTPDADARLAFLGAQQEVLERVARGAPLDVSLLAIVQVIEAQAPQMPCSVLLLDERGVLHHGAAPNLPASYRAAIDGTVIGPTAGSCGAAAYLNEVVEIEDIATHPYWADYRHLALPHGLRACWSTPIRASSGGVLGTFAMYFSEQRLPTANERAWVQAATNLCAIAIEQDRSRRALARGEAEMRAVFEHAAIGIAIGVPTEPMRVNPALARFLGYDAQEIAVLGPAGITHPDDLEASNAAFAALCADEVERYTIEKRYIRKNGHVVWGRVTTSMVPERELVKMTGSARPERLAVALVEDISVQKQLDAQALRAERIETLARFASSVAHDFNNLLTTIGGFARVARDELSDERSAANEALDEIVHATTRATDLVAKILTFSRDARPQRRVQSLEPIVDDVVRILRNSLAETIGVRVGHGPRLGLVKADANQMHQVVMSLGMNAAQAMPQGGELVLRLDRRVVADGDAAHPAGSWIVLTVADTGVGIDSAMREHLFEPFFSTRPRGQGNGLGLAMVQAVARGHDGHVVVHSEVGRGSTFEVWLPEVEAAAPPPPPPSVVAPTTHTQVLFVDDEPTIVRLAARELQRAGMGVAAFTDPEDALAELCKAPERFEVLVTDASMPNMSGFDLARRVRALRPDITIIVLSGGLWDHESVEVRELDISEFLLKPQALHQLPATVRRLTRRDV